jgi:uncharacterized protein YodC (DUF2158 family)
LATAFVDFVEENASTSKLLISRSRVRVPARSPRIINGLSVLSTQALGPNAPIGLHSKPCLLPLAFDAVFNPTWLRHTGRLVLPEAQMARPFNAGDIVQLKSGGPKMTVDRSDSDGVWAIWFAGAKRERAHFSDQSLILAKDEPTKK